MKTADEPVQAIAMLGAIVAAAQEATRPRDAGFRYYAVIAEYRDGGYSVDIKQAPVDTPSDRDERRPSLTVEHVPADDLAAARGAAANLLAKHRRVLHREIVR